MKTEAQRKEEWIAALRSGDYPQVKGTLKGTNKEGKMGWCCLGVYAEVVMGEDLDECNEYDCDGNPISEGDENLYKEMKRQVDPYVYNTGMSMNDDGYSFEEIADMIKEGWEV